MTDQEMDELFDNMRQPGNDEAGAQVMDAIRANVLSDTKAVRPLPANSVLAAVFFLIVAGVALLGGVIAKPHGFVLMSLAAKVGIFGALTVVIAFAALMTARSMRPGSGSLHAGLLTAAALILLEIVFFSVFQSYDVSGFIPAGLVCLGLGLAYAVPTAAMAWLVIRRGYVVDPAKAGLLIGMAGGLGGLGMLEFHCPLLTVPHAALWHVAVVVVSLFGGWMFGVWRLNHLDAV
jgi:hypothetical protein